MRSVKSASRMICQREPSVLRKISNHLANKYTPKYKKELEKIIHMPMLWVFIAICFVLNTGIIFIYRQRVVDYDYVCYVGQAACVMGDRLGDEFSGKLARMPESKENSRLVSETEHPAAIYADYDTNALADAYIGVYGVSGAGADLLTKKYERLQAAVGELGRAGAEFSLYVAGETKGMHDLLFGVVLRAVVTESCMLAVLIMLYLLAYERQNRTESVVYATKTGRRIHKYQFLAGILLTAVCYLLLACGTLLAYFLAFNYSQLWSASVSSGFNYISDMIGVKPFLTWIPFTVAGYLLAMLGLGLVLTLVFSMMGAVIGFVVRNSYVGVLLFFLLALAMMVVPYLFSETGIWSGYFLLQFSPVRLWFVLPEWFTDMGSVSVLPFHETVGVLVNVLFWGSLVAITYQFRKRGDVESCC